MRRLGLLLPVAIFILIGLFAFRTAPENLSTIQTDAPVISWMSFEEAMEAVKIEERKILISVHTEWCGWCKHMDKTTFQNPDIVKFINQKFYAVKLDAERKTDITTPEKVYKYIKGVGKERGYHELAAALTMGRLTLPSTVFLDESLQVLQPISGYKDSKTFEMIMTYYGDNHYKSTPYTLYQKSYIPLEQLKLKLISE